MACSLIVWVFCEDFGSVKPCCTEGAELVREEIGEPVTCVHGQMCDLLPPCQAAAIRIVTNTFPGGPIAGAVVVDLQGFTEHGRVLACRDAILEAIRGVAAAV